MEHREVLFRGKRVDNGEWFEGFYAKSGEKTYIIYDNDIAVGYVSMKEVVPETIGQYTGLRDCKRTEKYPKGQKIFEGDIVKFGDIIGVINYDFGCFCVKTNKPDWKSRNNPAIDIIFNEYPNEVEIIGNIHDNPELLKGGVEE